MYISKKIILMIFILIVMLPNIAFAENSYIKWVDFNINSSILTKIAKLDIDSHKDSNSIVKFNFAEILAYLASKYGGDFTRFNSKDLDTLISELQKGITIEEMTTNSKYYNYYHEVYTTIFDEYIGEYSLEKEDENGNKIYETVYGIKAFSPIAKNYSFSHYRDFGNSRSYGYKRLHLGNDMMGSIGTPIIAVESGIVEVAGWNQYGGWRIGIRSFDGKKYYYYAHLRKDHPFAENIYEGKVVTAGDVIGYLGMTGYSAKENVNNINVPHLHFRSSTYI